MIFEITKIISLILIGFLIFLIIINNYLNTLFHLQNIKKIDTNFKYENYQRYLINKKIIKNQVGY